MPHRGLESVSVLRLAFQSVALPKCIPALSGPLPTRIVHIPVGLPTGIVHIPVGRGRDGAGMNFKFCVRSTRARAGGELVHAPAQVKGDEVMGLDYDGARV